MDVDCIVVGSGPAGSTAARHLAAAGVRTVILERARLPRPKTCGGAVSGLAASMLDVPWQDVSERRLGVVEVRHQFSRPLICETPEPYADFVMRDRFDELLAHHAINAGAALFDGCRVQGIHINPGYVEVATEAARFRAPCVIGADGAHSIVARRAGLPRVRPGVALEAEIDVSAQQLREFAERAVISYDNPHWGYGWIFPKGSHLSVGVGTLRSSAIRLRDQLREFLQRFGLHQAPMTVSGHPIPAYPGHLPISTFRVLLAGDAAYLNDPLSGEGIAHAIHSGKLAANAVLQSLSTGQFHFRDYAAHVHRTIGIELQAARQVARLFYRMPGLFFTLFERSPSLLAFYFDIVRGRSTYRELARRLPGELWRTNLSLGPLGRPSDRWQSPSL